jgi:hypothetical protein
LIRLNLLILYFVLDGHQPFHGLETRFTMAILQELHDYFNHYFFRPTLLYQKGKFAEISFSYFSSLFVLFSPFMLS